MPDFDALGQADESLSSRDAINNEETEAKL